MLAKTVAWLVAVALVGVLLLEWNREPSGRLGLDRKDRAAVDSAVEQALPPADPFLRRVADAYAAQVMRAGAPGRAQAVGLAVAVVAACVLAARWWVLALWLGATAFIAASAWRRRGLAPKAERYLAISRQENSGAGADAAPPGAPPRDAPAFRQGLDERPDPGSEPRP